MNNIEITDNRFDDFSTTVIANVDHLTAEFAESDSNDITAYPQSYRGCILTDVDCVNQTVLDDARSFVEQLEQEYDLVCTLCVYYPADGFIGWHTNSNVKMYNAICTFSDDGLSFFEYQQDQQTTRVNDAAGWTVKKSHWTGDDPVPHRAVSNNHRITVTLSSKTEQAIDDFIAAITG